MTMLNSIKTRRSARQFNKRHIEKTKLDKILEAGRWAPSGLNNQPWKFVVIRDSALKARLAGLTESSDVLLRANMAIAVFLDKEAMYNRDKDMQAIGASIQNMLLEAESLGLGACWLGEILNRKEDAKKLLKIGSFFELAAVVALGYPARGRRASRRKSIKSIILKRYI